MIRIEANDNPFMLTNDQFSTITHVIGEHGWDLDYDVVEGDTDDIIWLWIHHEVNDDALNPERYWIEIDGQISLKEEVTWDWKGIQHDA